MGLKVLRAFSDALKYFKVLASSNYFNAFSSSPQFYLAIAFEACVEDGAEELAAKRLSRGNYGLFLVISFGRGVPPGDCLRGMGCSKIWLKHLEY